MDATALLGEASAASIQEHVPRALRWCATGIWTAMPEFLMGVNYWPRRSAMAMWTDFDAGEIREDFAQMVNLGLRVVRLFLRWDAFQPQADTMDAEALRRFETTLDLAQRNGLMMMPTLFSGHMSGVNWVPKWALDPSTPATRFRTVVGTRFAKFSIGDFYADARLLAAQRLQARTLGTRFRGHPAIETWDLGNEFSTLRAPARVEDADRWSEILTRDLVETSGFGATGGLHSEDISLDHCIRPSSIAKPWRYVTMHGYPVYTSYARSRTDVEVVPFLHDIVRRFSGKQVLFTEFGNPGCPTPPPMACLDEDEMAVYARGVLELLHARGALGAFWWCWTDYDTALASLPPFDEAPHELRFGLIREDGTEKPVASVLSSFAREKREVANVSPDLSIDETSFYAGLPESVDAEFRRYVAMEAHR